MRLEEAKVSSDTNKDWMLLIIKRDTTWFTYHNRFNRED